MSPVDVAQRLEWSQRLSQAMVAGGYATDQQLAPLVAEVQATGIPLGTLLIARQVAPAAAVVGALAQASQMQAVDLAAVTPQRDAVAALPQAVGREYGAVGVMSDGSQLVVAFGEPPSPNDLQALSSMVGYQISPVLADPMVIEQVLAAGPDGLASGASCSSARSVTRRRLSSQSRPRSPVTSCSPPSTPTVRHRRRCAWWRWASSRSS